MVAGLSIIWKKTIGRVRTQPAMFNLEFQDDTSMQLFLESIPPIIMFENVEFKNFYWGMDNNGTATDAFDNKDN